jgi:hypothetical protein
VAGAELVERAALHHLKIAARLAVRGTPVGAAGERHVGRIGIEIEAVDRPADHLLFPMIVEIGQQRGARPAYRGMNVAVDPRGNCRHGCFPDFCTSWRPAPQPKSALMTRGAQGPWPGLPTVKMVIGDLGTYAGIKTDENARALDVDGHPIAGLYAAGNDMASIMGGNYPGAGITLGPALTFGYIAGKHISGAAA